MSDPRWPLGDLPRVPTRPFAARYRRLACEQAALEWLRSGPSPQALVDALTDDRRRRQDRAGYQPLAWDRSALALAERILTAVRGSRRLSRIEALPDLLDVEGVDDAVVDALRELGCARVDEDDDAADDGSSDDHDEPDGDEQPPGQLPGIGVWLPVRLETRFELGTTNRLRVRIVPDEPWFSRHDPRPSSAELADVGRTIVAVAAEGQDAEVAWEQLVHRHGGGRARWLLGTFVGRFDADGTLTEPVETSDGDPPRWSRVVGFPSTLQLWLARGGAPASLAATLTVDHARLDAGLPLDTADDVDDDPPPTWWSSWDEAVAAGLATTLDLGSTADDIDALYVVGVDGAPPDQLLGDHRDAGLLGLLAPGDPSATVDGAPAVATRPTAAEWRELADRGPTTAEQRVAVALTGEPDTLGPLPGHGGPDSAVMVSALWPALWGWAGSVVAGLGSSASTAARWAAGNLHPTGPMPTLRLGAQPYGLLPVTAPGAWQASNVDPALEQPLATAVEQLLPIWSTAGASGGTVEGVDAPAFLELLARVPSTSRLRLRQAWPLEIWQLFALLQGQPVSMEILEAEWDSAHPLVGQLGLDPVQRFGADDWSQPLPLPLVVPEDLPDGVSVKDLLATLAGLARGGLDRSLAAGAGLGSAGARLGLKHPPASLLLVLVNRSLELAFTAVLADDTSADRQRGLVIRAIEQLADWEATQLEAVLRATLDTASHRLDPWATGLAWRRLGHLGTPRRGMVPSRRLGAYGWVDAPRPGTPGPTDGGLIHAPSQDQAATAAILRDRAVNDPEPERWAMDVDSGSARLAERLARAVRSGLHLPEAVGAELERATGDRQAIDALRTSFPIGEDSEARRVCDGLTVLDADPGELPAAVPDDTVAALRHAVASYGDLLVAEAVHDLVQGRADAAGAALDAAAGLARPPELEVLRTRHEGRSIGTSCLVVLPGPDAADVPDSPAGIADPATAALLVRRFGPAEDWRWQVGTDGSEGTDTRTVRLTDLGLHPADALALPLAELEALVAASGGAPLRERDGSHRWRRAAALIDHLPTTPADRPDLEVADADDVRRPGPQLRERLALLRTRLADLQERLRAPADADQADTALIEARRIGIAPIDGDRDARCTRAAERLGDRLADAPSEEQAQELDVSGLIDAVRELVSATGHLAVLTLVDRAALMAALRPDLFDRVRDDWLPTLAATRERLGRLEATMLSEEFEDGPVLVPWTDQPDDPWSLERDRAMVAFVDPALDLDAADPGTPIAVGLVDRFAEVVPGEHHATAAAFGFDAPAARAPQAILLAVPPDPNEAIDHATAVDILVATRALLRGRMATPAQLDALAGTSGLLPAALLPSIGPTSIAGVLPPDGSDVR